MLRICFFQQKDNKKVKITRMNKWLKNNVLPMGWVKISLRDILTLEYGKSLIALDRENGFYKVWGSNGIVGTHNNFLVEGPVIIVGRKGSVGTVNYSAENCWPIDTTYYINSIKSLSPQFVFYLLQHLNLPGLDKSTTIPGLNRESVYSQNILLPPLNEQYRIVEKIEELFSEIENVETNIYDIKQRLDFYWQTILHYAFCGHLSHEWQVGEIVNNNSESFNSIYEIPPTWKWVELDTYANFIGAGSTPKGGRSIYIHSGIPFIRSQNVLHYSLNLDDVVYITDEINEKMSRTQTQINDVLLNITGASIGRCTYIPDSLEQANVNQHVCIIRTKSNLLYKYLSLYLNSPAIQHLIKKWSSGATREALTISQIKSIPLPVCSLEEQEFIVSELESQHTILEHIKKTLEKKIDQIQMLKQSVLNKAFTGRLVSQNSNDESAFELLKKIKAERLEFAESKPKEKKVKKNKEKMERTKSVLELLKEAQKPVPAKELWQQSKHWESIDDFYTELKSISDSLEQIKSKTEILLSLKK